jgi:hypothetical protein
MSALLLSAYGTAYSRPDAIQNYLKDVDPNAILSLENYQRLARIAGENTYMMLGFFHTSGDDLRHDLLYMLWKRLPVEEQTQYNQIQVVGALLASCKHEKVDRFENFIMHQRPLKDVQVSDLNYLLEFFHDGPDRVRALLAVTQKPLFLSESIVEDMDSILKRFKDPEAQKTAKQWLNKVPIARQRLLDEQKDSVDRFRRQFIEILTGVPEPLPTTSENRQGKKRGRGTEPKKKEVRKKKGGSAASNKEEQET